MCERKLRPPTTINNSLKSYGVFITLFPRAGGLLLASPSGVQLLTQRWSLTKNGCGFTLGSCSYLDYYSQDLCVSIVLIS